MEYSTFNTGATMNIIGASGLFGNLVKNPQGIVERVSSHIIDKKDKDGDAKLSLEELGRKAEKYQKADTDNDGYITQQEINSALNAKINAGAKKNTFSFDSLNSFKSFIGKLRTENTEAKGLPSAERLTNKIFDRHDDDGDGLLSSKELGDGAEIFAFADTDEDGSISKEETLEALSNRQQSVNSLKAYASSQGTTLKEMMISKLNISEEQANKVLDALERNSLNIRA